MTDHREHLVRGLSLVLLSPLMSVFFAAGSFDLVASTDPVRTDMDALELMSRRMDQNTDRFNQEYIYTGKDMDKGLRAAPVPVTADAKAAPFRWARPAAARWYGRPATI